MLILVEGPNDEKFIKDYLEYLGLRNKFEVKYTDGKKNLRSYKKDVEKNDDIRIIFDAGKCLQKVKDSIKEELGDNLFDKCEIFLIPNNKDIGDLEILIENIAKEKCILECFEQYKKCIEKLQNKNENIKLPAKKSKAFAYLESFGFKNKNGDENFKFNEDIFDLDSEYLSPLKDFLLK